MNLNVDKEVAALQRMTVGELREKFAEVFGECTNARHKKWLVKRIAWRMQALVEGDISERARQRAAELANDTDLRTSAPKSTKPAEASPERTMSATLAVAADDRLPYCVSTSESPRGKSRMSSGSLGPLGKQIRNLHPRT